jgi:hypothetical protein
MLNESTPKVSSGSNREILDFALAMFRLKIASEEPVLFDDCLREALYAYNDDERVKIPR